MNKVYVDVVAEFRKDGRLVPIFFTWEDGRKYSIDRILKIERCASRKAGGVGVMYTCIKSSFPIIVLLFEQQRRTCHTAVRRLYLY